MSETELSFAEEQLWLADQTGSSAFPFFDCTRSLSIAVRLENALDHQALKTSLAEIVRRHDVLRSRFVARNGRPARVFLQSPPGLRTVDVRKSAREDRSELIARVLEHDVAQRFDLTRGPLLRAILVALADDDHVLAITVHHIVFDRWSMRVFARELKQLYEAYASGRTPVIEPLRARYRDYVQWQRLRLDTGLSRELVAYWTERLRGLAALPLSGDRGCEQVPSTRAGRWFFTIPEQETSRLVATSRRSRVTPATLLLAVLTLLLSRLSGQGDIAVGVPLSDRRHPDFEPLIGLFANVVVVRTMIADRITFLNLLERVHHAFLDACRYQDLPYGHLLRVLGAQTPLYRTVFNFLPEIRASHVELEGVRVTPLQVPAERLSLADLSLHVRRDSGALACRLVYKADLFSPTWAQAFAAQFQTLVTAVLDEPRMDVSAYDLTVCGSLGTCRESPPERDEPARTTSPEQPLRLDQMLDA
jgi:hypothetical protein